MRKSLILRIPVESTATAATRLYRVERSFVDARGNPMTPFDTLTHAWMAWDGPARAPEEAVLDQTRELEKFLAEVERRGTGRQKLAPLQRIGRCGVVQWQ